jgi:molybdopterin-guanine dinucleotide biosynthesis protein A
VHALGVLLAGGRGMRLGGGAPKALALCAGRTLVERARDMLRALCDTLVIVAPDSLELPVPAVERLPDPPDSIGPLPAMVAGLAARAHDEALVLAVDLPLVGVPALAALRARRSGARAIVPRPGGMAQPLAAWYSGEAGVALAGAIAAGERSVITAVTRLHPRWMDDEELAGLPGGMDAWLNVNTRDELAVAEARLLSEPR